MNSLDPWRFILTNPWGDVIVPAPSYGHPFYREIPSWIHYGNGNGYGNGYGNGNGDGNGNGGDTRLLFEGAFIGAEVPGSQRTGLTAEVAPVLAPATGGFSARTELDDRQLLHVEICVDGKCYKSSMDLAPAITAVMAKFAQVHHDMHKARSSHTPAISGDARINRAAGVASDAMIGALLDHHTYVACAGWLDDIGNAIGGTLRKLKPAISAAATAVATHYGGAAAGTAAGQLVGPIADVGANSLDPQKTPQKSQQAQASQQIVDQAKAQAKTDPVMAKALNVAQQAVAHATVAYHVKDVVQKAAQGDPVAQQQSQQLAKAADQGDPAAQSAMDIAKQVLSKSEQNAAEDIANRVQHSEWGAQLWEDLTGRGPDTVSGW